MDEWNKRGLFYPTLMIAYEVADTPSDLIPLLSYMKDPGCFLQIKFIRDKQPKPLFKLKKANEVEEE